MCNHDNGNAIFVTDINNLADNLSLSSYVQRTGRFVGQKDFRAENHSHSNTYTLTHTTGQLKRIAVHDIFRVRQAHVSQHITAHLVSLVLGLVRLMSLNIVNELLTDAADRINHVATVLENHGHLTAIHFAPFIGSILQYILAIKDDAAAANAASTRQATHNSADNGSFATAGLANDGHNLALIQF